MTIRQNDAAIDLHTTPQAGGGGGALVEIEHLAVTIHDTRRDIYAVRDVSLRIDQGRTIVLVGESGSGKSVCARTILGLYPVGSVTVMGSVRFGGYQLVGLSESEYEEKIRGPGISMVFQDPTRSLNPTMRVGRQISESVRKHLGFTKKQAADRAVELLDVVGIPNPRDRVHDYPHQLSGGMRQRVMMAIAISCNPQVLIADEPTTALDVTTEAQIMELLISLQHEFNMGLMLITHDMSLAFEYADQIAVMYAGRIVERAPSISLMTTVRMPYTRGLLDSVPRNDSEPHEPFEAMPGRPPDPSILQPGCAFAPRCRFARAECSEHQPRLVNAGGDHDYACFFPLTDDR
jgi:oligopeptide/dipeptide ABC transporter ATP-binding protein